ncbi:XRE family transcriptional regulator [Minwuia thermotolerans]|nr:XRE family transcriptional regulator [Minwuia thermotolerans]
MKKKFDGRHLKAWRNARGLKQADLADAIGRVSAVISRIENGVQPINEDQLARAAALLDATPEELLKPPPATVKELRDRGAGNTAPAFGTPAIGSRHEAPRDVPLHGTAAGSFRGAFEIGNTVDYVRRPAGLAGAKNAYALQVVGDSMAPRYEHGDLIYVHPDRVVRRGDDIVFTVKADEHAEAESFVKRLVSRSSDKLVVEQYNPPQETTWEARLVIRCHKVMRNHELYGV